MRRSLPSSSRSAAFTDLFACPSGRHRLLEANVGARSCMLVRVCVQEMQDAIAENLAKISLESRAQLADKGSSEAIVDARAAALIEHAFAVYSRTHSPSWDVPMPYTWQQLKAWQDGEPTVSESRPLL